jgi:hypothetical protein
MSWTWWLSAADPRPWRSGAPIHDADWSKRYPRIVEEAARIKGNTVMDAEVVCLVKKGVADFDMLHSRVNDHFAVACAFPAASWISR